MRRPIRCLLGSVLAVVLLFSLLTSCKSEPLSPDQIRLDFTCDAAVTVEDSEIGCTFSHTAQGVGYVLVTVPEQLAGVCFEWMGDAYCISYNGLKCETDKPFLPNSSFATALMNVLEGAADTDALTRETSDGGVTVFSGDSRSGLFRISVDNASGYIVELSVDALKLRAELTNHK